MTTTIERPASEVTATADMPVADIAIHPQYRRRDLGKLRDLQQSIRREGLLRPVPVTTDGMLIAGERRLRAARNLRWETIPVTIARDNRHAIELLTAEHADTGPGHKPCSATELVLIGLRAEEFEQEEAERRRFEGRRGAPAEERFNSRDIAADLAGLSRKHYIQVRPMVLASLGYYITSGGHERMPVSREWARRSQEALEIVDRICAGERIPYSSPSGRQTWLTINTVYAQWSQERSARTDAGSPNFSVRDRVVVTSSTTSRKQREALAAGLATLTGLCHGLASITEIDASITSEEAAGFDRDLSNASQVLRGLHRKIKEYAHGIR